MRKNMITTKKWLSHRWTKYLQRNSFCKYYLISTSTYNSGKYKEADQKYSQQVYLRFYDQLYGYKVLS